MGNNYFAIVLVLFILLVIIGCGGWFGCGCQVCEGAKKIFALFLFFVGKLKNEIFIIVLFVVDFDKV